MNPVWRTALAILLLAPPLALAGCGTTGPTGAAPASPAAPQAPPSAEPTAALSFSRPPARPGAPDPSAVAPASTAPAAITAPGLVSSAPSDQPAEGPRLVGPEPAAPPSGPGQVEGAPPSAPRPEAPSAQPPPPPITPTAWLTYTSQTYRFTIVYPDTYTPLDQGSTTDPSQAQRLFQVRFQDQRLASGATAGLELPQFQIEVFDNSAALPLERWLDEHDITGERAEAAVGRQSGLKVTLMTMMAPNQFYYLAQGMYVYRLTPLGPFSEHMLASFSPS